MMLVIDSGNSRVKLGVTARPPLASNHPCSLPTLDTTALDNRDLRAMADWLAALPERPARAWGVNVAGADQARAIEQVLGDFDIGIRWQQAQARAGWLRNGYTQPARLGADRWASMVGVAARLGSAGTPFLLACFGTATTIDIVDGEGLFQGGVILPGPALMRRALAAGTADLPLATAEPVDFPTDTHAAIATGVAAAQAGAFVRQCQRARVHLGRVPALFACGGGWHDVEAETRRLLAELIPPGPQGAPAITFLNHPVLDGLAFMARDALPKESLP